MPPEVFRFRHTPGTMRRDSGTGIHDTYLSELRMPGATGVAWYCLAPRHRPADREPSCATPHQPLSIGAKHADGGHEADPGHGMSPSVAPYRKELTV
ncbi:hypothetical protein ACFWZ2_21390 [Streptomyces sp. NPDC059002]|uniref:hypothetical protein n=1 Tax=Streptomyces sp. NPDC059002 TaxID=3346690 RepID=UPI003682143D